MKSFWSYIKGDKYDVGCTGAAVCVYDKAGNEVKEFKGMSSAIYAAFIPFQNRIIVKSTTGMLAVYSLDEMKLEKKIRFSKMGGQDCGFCFSYDGTKLYLIENFNGLDTRILVFETLNFTEIDRLFDKKDDNKFFTQLECFHGNIAVLGYMRNFGVATCGFVASLDEDSLFGLRRLDFTDFDFANAYRNLQIMGFTEKAKKWRPLPDDREVTEFSLVDLL